MTDRDTADGIVFGTALGIGLWIVVLAWAGVL